MILGVDLGTRRIAIACIDAHFVWSASVESAKLRRENPTEMISGYRLGLLAAEALEQSGVRPTKLFYERPIVFKNVNTAVGQALSAGALFSQLTGSPEQIYPSSVWKKEVLGHGNATKSDIRAWVEGAYPALAQGCAGVEDCYDAVAICHYGHLVAESG